MSEQDVVAQAAVKQVAGRDPRDDLMAAGTRGEDVRKRNPGDGTVIEQRQRGEQGGVSSR